MDPTLGIGGGLGGASGGAEAWFFSLPPVTRGVTTATFVLALLSHVGMMPAQLLIFDWQLALWKLQIWRFATNIFYIGRFSVGWVLHMYMWTQVSSDLEKNPVFQQASKGAYLFFIVIVSLALPVLSLFVVWPQGLPLHAESLLFAVLYYWSRRHAYTPVSIYFLTVLGYQLPFVLMLLHLLLGRGLWVDIIGLIAGHGYYFFREILPAQGGVNLLAHTPKCFDWVVNKIENARPTPSRTGGAQAPQAPAENAGFGARFRGGASIDGARGTQPFSGRGYHLGSS